MEPSSNRGSATLSLAVFAIGSIALVGAASLRTAMSISKSRAVVGKLKAQTTTFLLCDVQERFSPLIYHSDTVIQTCRYMTSVAKALRIPVIGTQQYTKVFGPTVADCFATPEDLAATPIFEKKLFSMLTPEVQAKLDTYQNTESYVIMGIEAHVCVQQTCSGSARTGHGRRAPDCRRRVQSAGAGSRRGPAKTASRGRPPHHGAVGGLYAHANGGTSQFQDGVQADGGAHEIEERIQRGLAVEKVRVVPSSQGIITYASTVHAYTNTDATRSSSRITNRMCLKVAYSERIDLFDDTFCS